MRRAARGSSKLIFGQALLLFETAEKTRRWWRVDPIRTRIDADDRRLLASQLDYSSWEHVAYTESFIDAALARGKYSRSGGPNLNDEEVASMRHGVSVITRARSALAALAR